MTLLRDVPNGTYIRWHAQPEYGIYVILSGGMYLVYDTAGYHSIDQLRVRPVVPRNEIDSEILGWALPSSGAFLTACDCPRHRNAGHPVFHDMVGRLTL